MSRRASNQRSPTPGSTGRSATGDRQASNRVLWHSMSPPMTTSCRCTPFRCRSELCDDDQGRYSRRLRRHRGRFTNDELRQKFIDVTAPQAEFLGLRIPDDDLELDQATAHYKFGDIDWSEFKQVLAGNGPCNKERLQARQSAHENGKWVREAAAAYAEKQSRRDNQAA